MIKKITTIHGTYYLLDEDNKKVKRVSKNNKFIYDEYWVSYMSATNLDKEPFGVGDNLFIDYGAARDMPWSASTEIVSIEDYIEEQECNHVIGYRHTFYDARLVEANELEDEFEPSTLFTYCPKCGEKL